MQINNPEITSCNNCSFSAKCDSTKCRRCVQGLLEFRHEIVDKLATKRLIELPCAINDLLFTPNTYIEKVEQDARVSQIDICGLTEYYYKVSFSNRVGCLFLDENGERIPYLSDLIFLTYRDAEKSLQELLSED